MAKTSSRSLTSVGRSVARRVVGRSRPEATGASTGTGPSKAAAEGVAKKTPTKGAAKKAPTKKAPTKKAPAKKTLATKTAAAAAPAKKTSAVKKSSAAKQAPAVRTPVKKAVGAKPPTTKQPAVKRGAPNRVPAKAVPAKAPVEKSPTKAGPAARKGSLAALVVLPGESAWTRDELGEVRTHLRDDVKRLAHELEVAEEDLHDLMRDAGDGAGHDQADVGSTTFERDQEMMITNNSREMMEQSAHALERISDGSYGVCEGCTEAIGKMRLMAFPRATLCMTCKQREERR